MKKVGIVTWYRNGNYGGTLQAYALYSTLQNLGYAPEFIHYERRAGWKMAVRNGAFHLMFPRSALSRDRIWRFVNRRMKQSPKLAGMEAIGEYCRRFDAMVCGSDQIWNAVQPFDPCYFLQFAEPGRRVAYAPSLGVTTEDPERVAQLKGYIEGIDYLSVRETQAAEYLRRTCGREAQVVLDPSLLLTAQQWRDVAGKLPGGLKPGGYILAYFLGGDERYAQSVNALSRKMGLPVKYISSQRKNYARNQIVCDPAQFIALVDNAACMVTDSFHGAVFSMNLSTPSAVFERFDADDPRNQNSRIHSIMKLLGCGDRLTRRDAEIDPAALAAQAGGADRVQERLEALRGQSLTYLRESLHAAADKVYVTGV